MSSPSKQSYLLSSGDDEMYVTKRNGKQEIVSFDKILKRIKTLGQEANIKINYTTLVMKVIDQLYDGISTTKIDELSAEQCASMSSIHPDYNVLAGRIIVSNHHKNTSNSFREVMTELYNYRDKHDKHSPLVTELVVNVAHQYEDEIEEMLDYERDFLIDYFGFKTLERAYLMKVNQKIVERAQHMRLVFMEKILAAWRKPIDICRRSILRMLRPRFLMPEPHTRN
jgi:ribonucleoside-diphosphate reductase alpha chain